MARRAPFLIGSMIHCASMIAPKLALWLDAQAGASETSQVTCEAALSGVNMV